MRGSEVQEVSAPNQDAPGGTGAIASRAVVLCLLTAMGAVGPLIAQSRVTSEVDTTLVTIGDRITMTVTVEHAGGSTVSWPDSLDLSPFEVLETSVIPPETTLDRVRTRAVFTLTAFELGELEIPGIDVEVVEPGGDVEVLTTDGFGVEVVSVGADESGDIRDIRGPLSIPVGLFRSLLWVLLPLGLAALTYWLSRRWQGRDTAGEPIVIRTPARPPHEIALEALDALEASGRLERGQVKDYHILVSSILRTYVEHRFGVDALELTTTEVLDGLRHAAVDASFSEGLGRFLERCDLVKFAKVRPAPDASREVLALGRRLVLDTVPVPESQVTDDGARLATVESPTSGGR